MITIMCFCFAIRNNTAKSPSTVIHHPRRSPQTNYSKPMTPKQRSKTNAPKATTQTIISTSTPNQPHQPSSRRSPQTNHTNRHPRRSPQTNCSKPMTPKQRSKTDAPKATTQTIISTITPNQPHQPSSSTYTPTPTVISTYTPTPTVISTDVGVERSCCLAERWQNVAFVGSKISPCVRQKG
jgi:hypothetical protein